MDQVQAQQTEVPVGAAGSCSVFIRTHTAEILACWELRVQTLPVARRLDAAAIRDAIPPMLAMIADMHDEIRTGIVSHRLEQVSEQHAIRRLEQDFDLASLVIELGMLRECIVMALDDGAEPICLPERRSLDEAIDRAVNAAIEHYGRARERTMQTLDRIASVALESRSLDDLVARLLQILVHTSEAIDTAGILIREGDALHVRASIGIEGGDAPAIIPVGEGFAGTIAATKSALEIHDASTDPLVARQRLRDAGIRALYGIPVIDAGEVIAVAHMGSRRTSEFSLDDKRLFRAMANRATAPISQYVLREAAQRVAEDLRRREEEFRALADNVPQFAWMADEHGRMYWYNQRWLDYTGTTLEEMRRSGAAPFHHPDHRSRVTEKFRQAVANKRAWEDTYPLRGRDGRYRWFLTRAIPIANDRGEIVRWFGTNTDITEQRFLDEATKVLNSSLDYDDTLQQIAQLAVPAIADWCVVDLVEGHHEVRRVAISHADPAQVDAGREYSRAYPPVWDEPTGVALVIRTGEATLAEQIDDAMLVAGARNGDHLERLRAMRLTSCIIAPLSARERTLGAITLVTTESGRRYNRTDLDLARELGRRAGLAVDNARLYKDSQQALQDREQALRSRDEVLAIVTHDLRNPLGAIGMSAAMLREDCGNLASNKRLELIERSAQRMERMIDDLLDMATIQAKGLTLERRVETIGVLLDEVIEAHEAKAQSQQLHISQDCDIRGTSLLVDRDRIERVFANLLGNAIKYCRPGDKISVRCRAVGAMARFSVSDTGPGIPPDQVPHLFEPFWSAKRQGAIKGTGLGLYIAKGIVEAHGGELWVETEPGQGAEFIFTLPLNAVADPPAAPASSPPAPRHS